MGPRVERASFFSGCGIPCALARMEGRSWRKWEGLGLSPHPPLSCFTADRGICFCVHKVCAPRVSDVFQVLSVMSDMEDGPDRGGRAIWKSRMGILEISLPSLNSEIYVFLLLMANAE